MPHLTVPELTAPSTPANRLQRCDWVEMELAKNFMEDARLSMAASVAVTWVMAVMLYNSVPQLTLLVWFGLLSVVILSRYRAVLIYEQQMQGVSGLALRQFFARHDPLWMLAGTLWGASMYLFLTKSSGFEQFICILILVGISCISLYSLASRLPCFFSFVNGLCGAVLVVLAYLLLAEKAAPATIDTYGLMALDVLLWLVLRYFGTRFHDLLRQSLQLQFDNRELIESLKAKSSIALEAAENKNRFIASAAHDLRQPVHALNLYASWLVDEPELSPQVAPQIVRCTNAVNDLFNSLFAFSGMTTDTPEVNWQSVNLAELLVDLQHQYAPLALERGLQLRLHSGRGNVWSDPLLLKRLLGNLISNALKNTRHGGVLLALRQRGGRWRIEVWDTGMGIEPRHQEAIFKEFYRVPRQGTQDGFGLGLAIVSRLSQVLGLVVSMRSTPGRGSVFCIEGKAIFNVPANDGLATKGLAF